MVTLGIFSANIMSSSLSNLIPIILEGQSFLHHHQHHLFISLTLFFSVVLMFSFSLSSHFKLSVSLTGVLFVSSLFTTGYVSWSNEHIPNSEDPFTQFDKIYDKPWTRLGPYLVGMATGWILFKTNLKIRMGRVRNCLTCSFFCPVKKEIDKL